MDLLLEGMEGKVEDEVKVRWVWDHEDKRTTRRMMSKHQRGNVKADANCTTVKRWYKEQSQAAATQEGVLEAVL